MAKVLHRDTHSTDTTVDVVREGEGTTRDTATATPTRTRIAGKQADKASSCSHDYYCYNRIVALVCKLRESKLNKEASTAMEVNISKAKV